MHVLREGVVSMSDTQRGGQQTSEEEAVRLCTALDSAAPGKPPQCVWRSAERRAARFKSCWVRDESAGSTQVATGTRTAMGEHTGGWGGAFTTVEQEVLVWK